jgi:hypothetical protein
MEQRRPARHDADHRQPPALSRIAACVHRDAADTGVVLWQDTTIGDIHWQSPIMSTTWFTPATTAATSPRIRRGRAARSAINRAASYAGTRIAEDACQVKIWPGNPYPLGATYDGADEFLRLFRGGNARRALTRSTTRAQTCLDFPESTGFIWHGYIPNAGPGQRYGFRVHGLGNRRPDTAAFPPNFSSIRTEKDRRRSEVNEAIFPYHFQGGEDSKNEIDSAPFAEVGRHQSLLQLGKRPLPAHAVARDGDLRGSRQRLHKAAPADSENMRGTYAGLSHPAAIKHLRTLESRPSSSAGPSIHSRLASRRARPAQLLGLQLDRYPAGTTSTHPADSSGSSRNSSRW